MSNASRLSTPVAQSSPSTPRTGTWRHPKLDEIVQRQNATNFSDRNLKKIVYNVGGIVIVFFLARSLWTIAGTKALHPYATWIYHILQTMFLYNIAAACLPLFHAKDDLSDIPLTPAQRKLLGLPPSSAPPTPGSQYITPPRYARTPTPLSGSPSSKRDYSSSPLSGKGSPNGSGMPGSPFSPGSSPLLQKAMGGGLNGNRRASYGSPSPLGPGGSRINVPETPGTPSPLAAKGSNVGLNSKWLYEKGRRNSGNAKLYT